jgi:hypothetical protein
VSEYAPLPRGVLAGDITQNRCYVDQYGRSHCDHDHAVADPTHGEPADLVPPGWNAQKEAVAVARKTKPAEEQVDTLHGVATTFAPKVENVWEPPPADQGEPERVDFSEADVF